MAAVDPVPTDPPDESAALARGERRRHPRVALVVDADVKVGGDGTGVHCATSDLSESGVRLRTDGTPLPPGRAFLVLTPPHGDPVASLVELLETRPTGEAAGETHVRFLHLPPASRGRLGQLIDASTPPDEAPTRRRSSGSSR